MKSGSSSGKAKDATMPLLMWELGRDKDGCREEQKKKKRVDKMRGFTRPT